jgi:O-antigen ligase
LHHLELVLIALVAANLGFMAWAFGGVDLWSQRVGAGLALAALAVSVLPRASGFEPGGARWRRLVRFPGFWAGLFLYGWIAVQAMNPAFDYRVAGVDWWLERRSYVAWLPAGMNVPFAESSPLRTLLLWTPAWATACALWTGLTGRRGAISLLTLLVVNAFALACFGLLQRAHGADLVFGSRRVETGDFFATLIYKNHAAIFFLLAAFVAVALAVHSAWDNRRHPGRRGPAVLHLFFALTLMLAVGLTYSLSGAVLLLGSLLLVVPLTALRFARAFPARTGLVPSLLLGALLLVLLGAAGTAVGSAKLQERVRVKLEGEGYQSVRSRWLASRQGGLMFADRWLLGWGAGCFRYGFTKYQHAEPELAQRGSTRFRWEHLHNDWLEFLIEFGVLGALPFMALTGWWLRETLRLRLWKHPAICPGLVALGALALEAAGDFPLQNPSILLSAGALAPLLLRWGQSERRHHPGIIARSDS